MYKVKDNAEAQLQFGISSVATTLVVKEGQGAKFPEVPFLVVLNKRNSDWEITKSEKVEVSSVNGDQFTISRGYEWTTPSDFSADDFVSLFVLARHIEELQTEVAKKADQTDVQSVAQKTSVLEEKLSTAEGQISQLVEAGTPSYLWITGIVWEKYTMEDTLFLQKTPTLANSILPLNVWDTNTNKEQHIQRISSGESSNQLKLKMDKIWLPTTNVIVEVRKWIKVDVSEKEAYWYGGDELLASATLPYTTFQTEAQEITVNLNQAFQLPKWELYSVIVKQENGIVNSSNYYRLYCDRSQWSEAFSVVAVNGNSRVRSYYTVYCVSDSFLTDLFVKEKNPTKKANTLSKFTVNNFYLYPEGSSEIYTSRFENISTIDPNRRYLLEWEIEVKRVNSWWRSTNYIDFGNGIKEVFNLYFELWQKTKISKEVSWKDLQRPFKMYRSSSSQWQWYIDANITVSEIIWDFGGKVRFPLKTTNLWRIGDIIETNMVGKNEESKIVGLLNTNLSNTATTWSTTLGSALGYMSIIGVDGKTYKIPVYWE